MSEEMKGVATRPVTGSLEQVFSALLPLAGNEKQRHLFIPTRSAWTAYVDNGWTGTDAASAMGHMSRTLGCRGMRVGAVPHTLRKDKRRYGISIAYAAGHEPSGSRHCS
jgi:hypothetical protein